MQHSVTMWWPKLYKSLCLQGLRRTHSQAETLAASTARNDSGSVDLVLVPTITTTVFHLFYGDRTCWRVKRILALHWKPSVQSLPCLYSALLAVALSMASQVTDLEALTLFCVVDKH